MSLVTMPRQVPDEAPLNLITCADAPGAKNALVQIDVNQRVRIAVRDKTRRKRLLCLHSVVAQPTHELRVVLTACQRLGLIVVQEQPQDLPPGGNDTCRLCKRGHSVHDTRSAGRKQAIDTLNLDETKPTGPGKG